MQYEYTYVVFIYIVLRLKNAQCIYYLIVSKRTPTCFDASAHHLQVVLVLYSKVFLIK